MHYGGKKIGAKWGKGSSDFHPKQIRPYFLGPKPLCKISSNTDRRKWFYNLSHAMLYQWDRWILSTAENNTSAAVRQTIRPQIWNCEWEQMQSCEVVWEVIRCTWSVDELKTALWSTRNDTVRQFTAGQLACILTMKTTQPINTSTYRSGHQR